jgi:hypothetical protein
MSPSLWPTIPKQVLPITIHQPFVLLVYSLHGSVGMLPAGALFLLVVEWTQLYIACHIYFISASLPDIYM